MCSISNGNLDLPQTTSTTTGVVVLGGSPFAHVCCPSSTQNTFIGTNAGSFAASGGLSGVSTNASRGVQRSEVSHDGVGEHRQRRSGELLSNTAGFGNTASGFQALQANVAGIYNTAIGSGSLTSNHNGNYNTSIGAGALQATDDLGI